MWLKLSEPELISSCSVECSRAMTNLEAKSLNAMARNSNSFTECLRPPPWTSTSEAFLNTGKQLFFIFLDPKSFKMILEMLLQGFGRQDGGGALPRGCRNDRFGHFGRFAFSVHLHWSQPPEGVAQTNHFHQMFPTDERDLHCVRGRERLKFFFFRF